MAENVGPLPHTLEPALRKHGVPSKLNKGVVEVVSQYRVCSTGERLSANQVLLSRFTISFAVQHVQPSAVSSTVNLRILRRFARHPTVAGIPMQTCIR